MPDAAAQSNPYVAGDDPRDLDARWIRINGTYVELPAPPLGDGQPQPAIRYEDVIALANDGKLTNRASVTWRRYAKGDDDRSPSDYGPLRPTSGPLLRRPGLRFTVVGPGAS